MWIDNRSRVLHPAAIVAKEEALWRRCALTMAIPRCLPAAILGGYLLLGLILGGMLLGMQIKETRLADRYVTVKGLVERTVKSDSAIWPVTLKNQETTCSRCMRRCEEDRKTLQTFFAAQGIAPGEHLCGADPGDRQAGKRVWEQQQ